MNCKKMYLENIHAFVFCLSNLKNLIKKVEYKKSISKTNCDMACTKLKEVVD